MDNFAEFAKQITTVLGAISAVAAAVIAVSSKARGWLKSAFLKYREETGDSEDIRSLKESIAAQGSSIEDLRKITETQAAAINNLSEIMTLNQTLIENHVTTDSSEQRRTAELLDRVGQSISVNEDFMKLQCGKEVREIFNKYSSTKKLPLEKWEYIENLQDIYVNRLGGNSVAGRLLKEMEDWEIDHEAEDE